MDRRVEVEQKFIPDFEKAIGSHSYPKITQECIYNKLLNTKL